MASESILDYRISGRVAAFREGDPNTESAPSSTPRRPSLPRLRLLVTDTNTTSTKATTRSLFDFDFINDSNHSRTIDRILSQQPDDGLLPLVVTPNVDDIVQLRRPEHLALANMSRRARYILPDGQPIVWASRLAGEPLTARLPGSQLFGPLWTRMCEDHRRVVVLSPSEEVAGRLEQQNPSAAIVVAPYFDANDGSALRDLVHDIWAAVVDADAEFVILGISFPKQQLLARELLSIMADLRRRNPLILLVGGSLNMHTQMVPLAPKWVQRAGVEFLYRFAREPRRLFYRYFVRDTSFLPLMLREIQENRRRQLGGTS